MSTKYGRIVDRKRDEFGGVVAVQIKSDNGEKEWISGVTGDIDEWVVFQDEEPPLIIGHSEFSAYMVQCAVHQQLAARFEDAEGKTESLTIVQPADPEWTWIKVTEDEIRDFLILFRDMNGGDPEPTSVTGRVIEWLESLVNR